MADDDRYWFDSAGHKGFDFDDIDDAGGGDSNVSRLFGVAGQGSTQKRPDGLSLPDDVHSTDTSEESRSVRSDTGEADIPPRAASTAQSIVSRTGSFLSAGSPPTVESGTHLAILPSSPSTSITSTGKSIKQALVRTFQPVTTQLSSSATAFSSGS